MVGAELTSRGGKDYVVYAILASDGEAEWRVARRYRHFELLHRQLKRLACYRARLPPKRVFVHARDVDFVEDRRQALDAYLGDVVAHPVLAGQGALWEFLDPGSEMYELASSARFFRSLASDVAGLTGDAAAARPGAEDSLDRLKGLGKTLFAAATDATKSAIEISHDVVVEGACAAKSTLRMGAPSQRIGGGSRSGSEVSGVSGSAAGSEVWRGAHGASGVQSATGLHRLDLVMGESEFLKGPHASAPSAIPKHQRRPSGTPPPYPRAPTPSEEAAASTKQLLAPLYDIVDCVFQLGTRGFFRRQAYAVARQVLSFVAGTAIEESIAAGLRTLRSGPTLAGWIAGVQGALWPGGVWFQSSPDYVAPTAPAAAAAPGPDSGHVMHSAAVSADAFLTSPAPPPIDEDEIREAAAAILLDHAPATLIALVGKRAYLRYMRGCAEGVRLWRSAERLHISMFQFARPSSHLSTHLLQRDAGPDRDDAERDGSLATGVRHPGDALRSRLPRAQAAFPGAQARRPRKAGSR